MVEFLFSSPLLSLYFTLLVSLANFFSFFYVILPSLYSCCELNHFTPHSLLFFWKRSLGRFLLSPFLSFFFVAFCRTLHEKGKRNKSKEARNSGAQNYFLLLSGGLFDQ